MKYMILIYGSREAWESQGEAGLASVMKAHDALHDEITASGEFVETNELDTRQARVVRTRKGVPTVTDGPFTEAKEIVAGYYIVDCASMDRAVELAGRLTEAEFAPIEVRALGE